MRKLCVNRNQAFVKLCQSEVHSHARKQQRRAAAL
jgi:hypothetical protein